MKNFFWTFLYVKEGSQSSDPSILSRLSRPYEEWRPSVTPGHGATGGEVGPFSRPMGLRPVLLLRKPTPEEPQPPCGN